MVVFSFVIEPVRGCLRLEASPKFSVLGFHLGFKASFAYKLHRLVEAKPCTEFVGKSVEAKSVP